MSEVTNHTTSIKILPEHIIDQIKAGEVIERPSALIKELIENSLDAKATKIDITLIDNGMSLISLEDNGTGMTFEDAPYAFLRHATSKIEKFEDLYRLYSFGFRGEALASIAAISRLTCITYPLDKKRKGAKLIMNAGVEELCIPQESEGHGTKLYIKDLFYNTPARLKFIKSKSSEKIALKKIFQAFLLSNPQVEFSFKWDDDDKEIYRPKFQTAKENEKWRIAEIFYNKKDQKDHYLKDLVSVQNSFENYRTHGYFTHFASAGNAHKHHFLFVNNRLFFDKTLHQGIIRNLERFWPSGYTGHYVFFIQVPPEEIDVNVHPNKTQIKFFKPDVVYTLIMGGIKNSIHQLAKENHTNTHDFNNVNQSLIQMIDQHEQKDLKLQSFNNVHDHDQYSLSELKQSHNPTHVFNEKSITHLNSTADENVKYVLPSLHFKEWIITHAQDQLWAINRLKLYYFSLYFDFVNSYRNYEGQNTPLLISEPIKLESIGLKEIADQNKTLEELKTFGLECDFLDRDYLVLRTTPSYLAGQNAIILSKILILIFNSGESAIDNFSLWMKFFAKLKPEIEKRTSQVSLEKEIEKITQMGFTQINLQQVGVVISSEMLSNLLDKNNPK